MCVRAHKYRIVFTYANSNTYVNCKFSRVHTQTKKQTQHECIHNATHRTHTDRQSYRDTHTTQQHTGIDSFEAIMRQQMASYIQQCIAKCDCLLTVCLYAFACVGYAVVWF